MIRINKTKKKIQSHLKLLWIVPFILMILCKYVTYNSLLSFDDVQDLCATKIYKLYNIVCTVRRITISKFWKRSECGIGIQLKFVSLFHRLSEESNHNLGIKL